MYFEEVIVKLSYNAPVTLTFSFFSLLILLADVYLSPGLVANVFTAESNATFSRNDHVTYVRLFTYIFGHAHLSHLTNNLMYILLLGPALEERYGSGSLFFMIFITALLNGLINVFFFSTTLLGASGVVFMMILLTSFTNVRRGEIPLTFFLVAGLYVWMEFARFQYESNISYASHMLGGLCGSLFGFMSNRQHPRHGRES